MVSDGVESIKERVNSALEGLTDSLFGVSPELAGTGGARVNMSRGDYDEMNTAKFTLYNGDANEDTDTIPAELHIARNDNVTNNIVTGASTSGNMAEPPKKRGRKKKAETKSKPNDEVISKAEQEVKELDTSKHVKEEVKKQANDDVKDKDNDSVDKLIKELVDSVEQKKKEAGTTKDKTIKQKLKDDIETIRFRIANILKTRVTKRVDKDDEKQHKSIAAQQALQEFYAIKKDIDLAASVLAHGGSIDSIIAGLKKSDNVKVSEDVDATFNNEFAGVYKRLYDLNYFFNRFRGTTDIKKAITLAKNEAMYAAIHRLHKEHSQHIPFLEGKQSDTSGNLIDYSSDVVERSIDYASNRFGIKLSDNVDENRKQALEAVNSYINTLYMAGGFANQLYDAKSDNLTAHYYVGSVIPFDNETFYNEHNTSASEIKGKLANELVSAMDNYSKLPDELGDKTLFNSILLDRLKNFTYGLERTSGKKVSKAELVSELHKNNTSGKEINNNLLDNMINAISLDEQAGVNDGITKNNPSPVEVDTSKSNDNQHIDDKGEIKVAGLNQHYGDKLKVVSSNADTSPEAVRDADVKLYNQYGEEIDGKLDDGVEGFYAKAVHFSGSNDFTVGDIYYDGGMEGHSVENENLPRPLEDMIDEGYDGLEFVTKDTPTGTDEKINESGDTYYRHRRKLHDGGYAELPTTFHASRYTHKALATIKKARTDKKLREKLGAKDDNDLDALQRQFIDDNGNLVVDEKRMNDTSKSDKVFNTLMGKEMSYKDYMMSIAHSKYRTVFYNGVYVTATNPSYNVRANLTNVNKQTLIDILKGAIEKGLFTKQEDIDFLEAKIKELEGASIPTDKLLMNGNKQFNTSGIYSNEDVSAFIDGYDVNSDYIGSTVVPELLPEIDNILSNYKGKEAEDKIKKLVKDYLAKKYKQMEGSMKKHGGNPELDNKIIKFLGKLKRVGSLAVIEKLLEHYGEKFEESEWDSSTKITETATANSVMKSVSVKDIYGNDYVDPLGNKIYHNYQDVSGVILSLVNNGTIQSYEDLVNRLGKAAEKDPVARDVYHKVKGLDSRERKGFMLKFKGMRNDITYTVDSAGNSNRGDKYNDQGAYIREDLDAINTKFNKGGGDLNREVFDNFVTRFLNLLSKSSLYNRIVRNALIQKDKENQNKKGYAKIGGIINRIVKDPSSVSFKDITNLLGALNYRLVQTADKEINNPLQLFSRISLNKLPHFNLLYLSRPTFELAQRMFKDNSKVVNGVRYNTTQEFQQDLQKLIGMIAEDFKKAGGTKLLENVDKNNKFPFSDIDGLYKLFRSLGFRFSKEALHRFFNEEILTFNGRVITLDQATPKQSKEIEQRFKDKIDFINSIPYYAIRTATASIGDYIYQGAGRDTGVKERNGIEYRQGKESLPHETKTYDKAFYNRLGRLYSYSFEETGLKSSSRTRAGQVSVSNYSQSSMVSRVFDSMKRGVANLLQIPINRNDLILHILNNHPEVLNNFKLVQMLGKTFTDGFNKGKSLSTLSLYEIIKVKLAMFYAKSQDVGL